MRQAQGNWGCDSALLSPPRSLYNASNLGAPPRNDDRPEMPESEMPDPEEFHRINRLPPDVFAGVNRLMQRVDEILPDHSQLKEAGA